MAVYASSKSVPVISQLMVRKEVFNIVSDAEASLLRMPSPVTESSISHLATSVAVISYPISCNPF
jgi:hypothetical protein